MKLEEIPDPKPGPGQVLVDVRAIGVNPVDTYIRAGKYGAREFPYTPGFDAAAGAVYEDGFAGKRLAADKHRAISRSIWTSKRCALLE